MPSVYDPAELLDYEISAIAQFLCSKHKAPEELKTACAKITEAQNKANESNARAFCFTLVGNGDMTVYSALNLTMLPAEARFGVIVHELMHLWLQSGNEVTVDEHCVALDIGYQYLPEVPYICAFTEQEKLAHNLQCVSSKCVDEIIMQSV